MTGEQTIGDRGAEFGQWYSLHVTEHFAGEGHSDSMYESPQANEDLPVK